MNVKRNRGSEVRKYKKWLTRQVRLKTHGQQSLHDKIRLRYTQVIGVVFRADPELTYAAPILDKSTLHLFAANNTKRPRIPHYVT